MYKHLQESLMAPNLDKDVTVGQLKFSFTQILSDLLGKDKVVRAKLVETVTNLKPNEKVAEFVWTC